VKIEPAVMSSEIERLPDLEGFVKFASIPDWRRVTLSLPHGSLYGKGKQQAAGGGGSRAVAVGVVGAAEVPRASSESESIAATSAAQPGVGEFATPPDGGGASVRPPRARAFKKVAGTPVRKRRVKAADGAVAAGSVPRIDPQGVP
jgi:hypothetical protein